MSPIQDLNNLFFFSKVIEHGGYTAAADSLGVQTSKLSRRVVALESELGVRLLNRSTRRLSLTEAGRKFHEHCVALLSEAQAAKDAVTETLSSPRGLIRVSCPTGVVHSGVAELLGDFLKKWPDVQVALDSTNRRVAVVEEGVDVAIRIRIPPLEDSDLAVRVLQPSRMVLTASTSYAKQIGRLKSPKDIAKAATLSMMANGDRYVWRFRHVDGDTCELAHAPRLRTDDFEALRRATLAGVGVAFLPEILVAEDIAERSLVHLLPEWEAQVGLMHAVFPSRRGMVPAVREFLDALVAHFGRPL